MAAKPPKPPGNFLKSLLNQHNNSNNNINKNQKQTNNEDEADIKESGNSNKQHLIKAKTNTVETNSADSNITTHTTIAAAKKTNCCNCSNISIMHLFHEMKQEFPTIPDTIVTQCVNENCHQRENCIQMLKNELELNPIPAQSYPAKVLHPPNNNSNNNNNNCLQNSTTAATVTNTTTQKPPLQQKPLLVVQQKPPLKPIRPIRTAPLHPPNQQPNYSNSNNNCGKINSTLNKNLNTNTITTTRTAATTKLLGGIVSGEDLANSEGIEPTKILPQCKQSISTTNTNTNTNTTTNNVNVNSPTPFEVCNDDKREEVCVGGSTERNLPRQRPTTLNLNTQLQKQQQQQRQRLNIQLQQRFQEQRNRQLQTQLQQQSQNCTALTKPIRKAPLPPIAPKPSQFQLNHTNTNAVNSFLNETFSANHTTLSPPSESEISVSVSLSTPSPTSSSSSSHTTTHQPFNKPTQSQTNQQQHLQTKSPIRHRSVITLQPEPPYTRDFLFTPASLTYASSTPGSPSLGAPPTSILTPTKQTPTATNSSSSATSSPTASLASSQKSFTSVNLTLRPPVSPNDPNSALQPATIDITAGPGFSGASGGGKSLHYSSTSYDARLGYQQNFQITVTDECGIFSASRIRPQQQQQQLRCLNQVNIKKENQYAGNFDKETLYNRYNYVNSFLQQQQQQQFHNNNVVALQQNIQNSIQSPQGLSGGGTTEYISGNMCVQTPHTMDAPSQEILQRQKKKRDKLAAALREYKKRLGNIEQEINLLTGTIPTEGLSERLDEDIIKLRRDCGDMLRSSTTFTQPLSQQELAINHQPPQQQQQQQQRQQPQPFPRQKLTRQPPRPPPAPRQTSLDIIQHHSQTSTPPPLAPPAASLPNLNVYTAIQQQQQQNHTNSSLIMPPYYQQQSEPLNASYRNNNDFYTDHHNSNYIDDRDLVEQEDDVGGGVADDYDDEYEEVIEPWECNMCTFRNHPQLNICETCENVRIIPGRLTTNLSRALTNPNAAATLAASATATASPSLDLSRSPSGSTNNTSGSGGNGLNAAANGNLEHDTNLVQQQLQHFALHT